MLYRCRTYSDYTVSFERIVEEHTDDQTGKIISEYRLAIGSEYHADFIIEKTSAGALEGSTILVPYQNDHIVTVHSKRQSMFVGVSTVVGSTLLVDSNGDGAIDYMRGAGLSSLTDESVKVLIIVDGVWQEGQLFSDYEAIVEGNNYALLDGIWREQ